MTLTELELFRKIVKGRPEHIRGKVLGFGFRIDVQPLWPEIIDKQVEVIGQHGAVVSDDEINPRWTWAELTGFRDYLLEGLSSTNTYGETTCFLSTQKFGNLTDGQIRKFFGTEDIKLGFHFK